MKITNILFVVSESIKWIIVSASLQKSLFEFIIVYEFSFVSKKNTCNLSKSCIVNITNIFENFVVSKSMNWFVITNMQKSSFEIDIVYNFSIVMMQIRSEISKINVIIVNFNNIESIDEIFVFEFRKWFAFITMLFEIIVVYEFQSILKKISCDLSKINIVIVNFSDNESIDEIFAFEFRKWIIAFAKKKIFVLIVIYETFSKNSIAFDIEISNKSFVQNIVDMKISKKKIFEFTNIRDQKLKNSFALYFENIDISIVVNISFLEHLIHKNDFIIETFDFDIALNVFSKNSSIQHIENSETIKKNSIYIYELFALFVFDFSIDIDFEIYTTDSVILEITYSIIQFFVTSFKRKMQLLSFRDFALRNISFDWNRSIFFIDRRTFSIFICIIVSNVTFDSIEIVKIVDIENIEFCEKEQSFCFFVDVINIIIDNFVSTFIEISDIDFYEKKQFFCFIEFFVSISIECVVNENTNFYKKKQFCFFVDMIDVIVMIRLLDRRLFDNRNDIFA